MALKCPACAAELSWAVASPNDPFLCHECGRTLELRASPLRGMVLTLCSMCLSVAVAYGAGARGGTLSWGIILGILPVSFVVSSIALRLFPPVTVTGDYRSILFGDNGGEAVSDDGGSGDESRTASSAPVLARELHQREAGASEPSLSQILELSALGPTCGRVRDLRHRVNADTHTPFQPRNGFLLSLALTILTIVFLMISAVMYVASLPFELILRFVTSRRGLVLGPVQWLLSTMTAPISAPLRRRAKARQSCPLCGRQGTVDRVVDVTDRGNTRVSVLGFEVSVSDPGGLNIEPGERLTISKCEACLEHFIEGPYPD